MTLEFTGGHVTPESTVSSALVEDSYSHLKAGSDSRVNKSDSLEGLDKRIKEQYDQTLATILDMAQTVKNMPADVRNQFMAGIANMEGPAYDLVRKTC